VLLVSYVKEYRGRGTCSFEIPVNDLEIMEVGHTRRGPRELQDVGEWERKMWENSKRAHQSQTVCVWIGSRVLHHIPAGHPLSDNAETT